MLSEWTQEKNLYLNHVCEQRHLYIKLRVFLVSKNVFFFLFFGIIFTIFYKILKIENIIKIWWQFYN